MTPDMLPIIGSGPYIGDTFGHLLNLRNDPSHNLLFNRDWWIREWAKYGWGDSGLQIAFMHDSEHFELTECQFILSRTHISDELANRVVRHDVEVARGLNQTLHGKPPPGLDVHIEALCSKVRGPRIASATAPDCVPGIDGNREQIRLERENDRLATENERLRVELKAVNEDAARFKSAYLETLNSTCWKITAPLRALRGGKLRQKT